MKAIFRIIPVLVFCLPLLAQKVTIPGSGGGGGTGGGTGANLALTGYLSLSETTNRLTMEAGGVLDVNGVPASTANWHPEGTTNSDVYGTARAFSLVATNSIDVGTSGTPGTIDLYSTNGTYLVTLTVDANGTLSVSTNTAFGGWVSFVSFLQDLAGNALLSPNIADGQTPYNLGTSLTHTSGNLVEVLNNGIKVSIGYDGTVTAVSIDGFKALDPSNTLIVGQIAPLYLALTKADGNTVTEFLPGTTTPTLTPYKLDTVNTHTGGDLLDVNNNGTNVFNISNIGSAVSLNPNGSATLGVTPSGNAQVLAATGKAMTLSVSGGRSVNLAGDIWAPTQDGVVNNGNLGSAWLDGYFTRNVYLGTNKLGTNGSSLTYNGTTIGGGSVPTGTMVNSGASIANAIPKYNDVTGTNMVPTSVTIDSTNVFAGTVTVTNSLKIFGTNVVIALTDPFTNSATWNYGVNAFTNATVGIRTDNVFALGWNATPSGRQVTGEQAAGLWIENFYGPSNQQMEMYFQVFASNGTSARPFGIVATASDLNTVLATVAADTTYVQSKNQANTFLELDSLGSSSGNGGQMLYYGKIKLLPFNAGANRSYIELHDASDVIAGYIYGASSVLTLESGSANRINAIGVVNVSAGLSASTYAKAGGVLKSDTTTTGNVGGGEDTLISYTIPASVLGVNGDCIEFDCGGTFAATANSKTLKMYFGSTVFLNTSSLILNNLPWRGHGRIIRTGATTQKISVEFTVGGTLLSAINGTICNYTTAAETLSGTVVFKCTGSDDGGIPANNAVVQEFMHLKWLPNGN